MKKKKAKPAELVEAAIERIERHNPRLNAVVFRSYDEARAKATAKLSGAFAGVPMLLKDILGDKKGWPTRRGSRFVPETPSSFDATLVSRFEAAGLIPLGKDQRAGIQPLAVYRAEALRPERDYVPFTALQNITGQPAIGLPLACSKSGLPIGIQFVGRFGEEHVLLQLAAQIEEAEPWNKTRPPVYG